ncbi:MAG TPA: hypothetical protein VGB37_08450 [Candidatus Lokiarchaeia archaeon]
MPDREDNDKKKNFLGFRLSKNELEKLERIAEIEKKSKNTIAKQALDHWINLELFRKTNSMFILSKSIFRKLIAIANEETLEVISSDMADLIADITKYTVVKPMDFKHFNDYSINIIKFLGSSGIGWFNNIDIELKENIDLKEKKIIVKALHDLDENFSYFFSKVIKNLLNNYFEINITEEINEPSSNLMYLVYRVNSEK